LGIKVLEMLINIYKVLFLNDVHVGSLGFVKQFMEMKEALMDEK
jgi:DNA polymerase II small subunit/DNA polymerase delta subunit B